MLNITRLERRKKGQSNACKDVTILEEEEHEDERRALAACLTTLF